MKVFFGVLVLAPLIFCLDAERTSNGPKEKRSSRIETKITISYLLDGNEFTIEDAARNSAVGKWLNDVQERAQEKLKKDLKMEIKFEITDINITDEDLTHKIIYWSSDRLLHASTYLDHLKKSYQRRMSPDIICVLTNYTMYE
uniref:Putative ixodes 26 kDa salivary protein n=1 Tax=Ixodes ricinus TaxID=34613 RepID=A0A0K8RLD6_IXORI